MLLDVSFNPGAGVAAIGTPVNQGGYASFNTGSTTQTITTLADIAAGQLMIQGSYTNTFNNFISSISDPAGSTWAATSNSNHSGVAPVREIWWARAAGALTKGSTITITMATSTNRQGGRMISVPNMAVSPVDAVPTSNNSTATGATSIASGTLAQTNELLIGWVGAGADPGTFTPGGSWTLVSSNTSGSFVYLAYQIVSSTSSVAWAPTWVNSILNASIMASFKGL